MNGGEGGGGGVRDRRVRRVREDGLREGGYQRGAAYLPAS